MNTLYDHNFPAQKSSFAEFLTKGGRKHRQTKHNEKQWLSSVVEGKPDSSRRHAGSPKGSENAASDGKKSSSKAIASSTKASNQIKSSNKTSSPSFQIHLRFPFGSTYLTIFTPPNHQLLHSDQCPIPASKKRVSPSRMNTNQSALL